VCVCIFMNNELYHEIITNKVMQIESKNSNW